jgi:hypothetical protein
MWSELRRGADSKAGFKLVNLSGLRSAPHEPTALSRARLIAFKFDILHQIESAVGRNTDLAVPEAFLGLERARGMSRRWSTQRTTYIPSISKRHYDVFTNRGTTKAMDQ